MGLKLLFFTGFSKFVAHESVAFMLVLFSCYSRCLLVFFWGVVRVGWEFFLAFICFMVTLYSLFSYAFNLFLIHFILLYAVLIRLNPFYPVIVRHSPS